MLPSLLVPRGTTNVAHGKRVTSSDDFPIIGELSQITDGVKEGTEGNWVELGPGIQWVQIDLAKPCRIYAVHLWHYWAEERVYSDVIVRVADDEQFTTNVRTLFNNDTDNSSGLGRGSHYEYRESRNGLVAGTPGPQSRGQIARYVRLYSRGNTTDQQNQYTEVEVLGLPATTPLPPMDVRNPYAAPEIKLATGWVTWTPAWYSTNISVQLKQRKFDLGMTFPNLPVMKVPRGTRNMARGKRVTSNSAARDLARITDSDRSMVYNTVTELGRGLRWVQIDLEKPCRIFGVHVWHDIWEDRAYHDVIVRVADDAKFSKNVRTLFNNDNDNSSQMGNGTDEEYLESLMGYLVDARGPQSQGQIARYVRLYSNGNTVNDQNQYMEVDVIGQPAAVPLPPYGTNAAAKQIAAGPTGNIKLPPVPYLKLPADATNLASGRPVISNLKPTDGSLESITDGDMESGVELEPQRGWIQMDLGAPCQIYIIQLWHDYFAPDVYRDVAIQISDDPAFKKGVHTIFNNARGGKPPFGIGPNGPYRESPAGLKISTGAKGTPGRYVRFWSNGSQLYGSNNYLEIKVFGTTEYVPVKFVTPPGPYL